MTTHQVITNKEFDKRFNADLNEKLAIIILAAGSSSRLGQSKQLIKIDGQSLLERQCDLALSVTKNVYCVLGCAAQIHQQVIGKKPVSIVVNEKWLQGMSHSLAAGVKALPDYIDGVMIVLVDQWQLNVDHIESLIEQRRKMPENIIVASSCCREKSKQGPPVIFPKKFFSQLIELTGEQGAKPILIKHPKSIQHIEMSDAFIDLDTPEQLTVLQASL